MSSLKEQIKEEIDSSISEIFQERLSDENCSGDILPEETVAYDKALNTIADILITMLNRNK